MTTRIFSIIITYFARTAQQMIVMGLVTQNHDPDNKEPNLQPVGDEDRDVHPASGVLYDQHAYRYDVSALGVTPDCIVVHLQHTPDAIRGSSKLLAFNLKDQDGIWYCKFEEGDAFASCILRELPTTFPVQTLPSDLMDLGKFVLPFKDLPNYANLSKRAKDALKHLAKDGITSPADLRKRNLTAKAFLDKIAAMGPNYANIAIDLLQYIYDLGYEFAQRE